MSATETSKENNTNSSESHELSFPLRIPLESHKEGFSHKKLQQDNSREISSNRESPVSHQEESTNRTPEEQRELLKRLTSEVEPANYSTRCPESYREDVLSRLHPDNRRATYPDREDFTSQFSSDDQDDYTSSLPADLSSQRDIRGLLAGVAHGVFGTGNGKTLPEMIQSGRNAGLPLYVRCPICQKEFKQKSTLLQHGCIHIESRPYPCGECGKRFRQQSHLTQHLRIHTNEKPYGCLYCGRNFRQRTILNQHVRIHTGEKPYKCAQCGKDFRQKAILDQHTRTHQGDRPYCCPLPNCRRRFAAEAEVKRHVENHVGPKRKPPPPGVSMNPTPLVKPELYLPQCYTHPGNFQQQYAMSQLLGSTPPQPTALVQ